MGARKRLNKEATENAIIAKCQSSPSLSLDVELFRKKNFGVKDLKEICTEIRVEPIYRGQYTKADMEEAYKAETRVFCDWIKEFDKK